MPNLRGKTWTTTTPANVEDAQYWEDHLISDADAGKISTAAQTVGNTGTQGQVLTILDGSGNAGWEDPASSGHTIVDEDDVDMPYRTNLQFLNAEVTDDSQNDSTVVDCKGSKGDPGDAATITVGTVTTLPAGSSATVTNSGTTSSAVFDFGIPKGADGTGAVSSVNGQTGAVVLDADDVGALPDSTVIPDPQIQSDWDQSDNTAVDYIKNKPTIPVVDEFTASIAQANGKVEFDNLNPLYGYELFWDDRGANFDVDNTAIPHAIHTKREAGTNTGTIKLTYTIQGGTNGSSYFALRILK